MNQLKEMLEAYRNGERGLPTYDELAEISMKPVNGITSDRKREMFEEWATKQGSYDLSPYNWRLKSIGGVPYDGYVRPYKQDRTVHAFEGFVGAIAVAQEA